MTAGDLLRQKLRRLLRQSCDNPEAAGVRHCGGELGETDEMHAALNDRMLDAEHFGDSCFHAYPSRQRSAFCRSLSALLPDEDQALRTHAEILVACRCCGK